MVLLPRLLVGLAVRGSRTDARLLVEARKPNPRLFVDLYRPAVLVDRQHHCRDPAAVRGGTVLDTSPHSVLG